MRRASGLLLTLAVVLLAAGLTIAVVRGIGVDTDAMPDEPASPAPISPLDSQLRTAPAPDSLDELLGGGIPALACLTTSDLFTGPDADIIDSSDLDELVRTIAEQVAEMRRLEFTHDVEVDFLTSDELSKELELLLDESIDVVELAAWEDILTAFGAIPPHADLEQLYRELLDEQVAGYYDPDDGRLVVRVSDDATIGPIDRVTIAHEVEHALVDQAIGLPELDDPELDADAALARVAVVEGDATLLMNRWALSHLSLGEQMEIARDPDLVAELEQLERFPAFIQRELLFPYIEGQNFVCELYRRGGWRAVDAAYRNLPSTSAAILFPERVGDEPVEPPRLQAPADGTLRLADSFGAGPLAWLFAAPGDDVTRRLHDPLARASAWNAGEVHLWDLDGEPVVGLALHDRVVAGVPTLCSSVTEWYAAAFPDATRTTTDTGERFEGDLHAVIRCPDDEVRLAIAPELVTATDVVD